MRARERREHPARLEQPHRAQVDLLVAARRRLERAARARERRRIQHDEPEPWALALEPAELAALVTETQRAWQSLGDVSYGATEAKVPEIVDAVVDAIHSSNV